MNIVYARVSTEEQASGYSISAQIHSCAKKYHDMGITDFVEFIDDGYSGEYIERPALDRLRVQLRDKQIKSVMIYDPDRMSRNLTVQLIIADEIEKAGANLFFVTGDYDMSPEGRLFFQMKGAISAYEKGKIRERTMAGKRAKAMKGKLTHNDRPLGYDYDYDTDNYIVNPLEAETIKLIYNMYLDQNLGVYALATHLRAMGVKTKKGAWFSGGTIWKVLTNEMYAGTKWAFKYYDKKISQYKTQKIKRDSKDWISVDVPAIINRQQWDAVQDKLKLNQNFSGRRAKFEYLLKNAIKCEYCGYSLTGMQSAKKNNTYHHYGCSSKYVYKRECNARLIPSTALDNQVWNDIYSLAQKEIVFTSFPKNKNNQRIKPRLENYLAELKERQGAFLKWVNDGTVTLKIAEKELLVLQKEIAATQSAMAAVKENSLTDITTGEILEATTFTQKRNIIIRSGVKIYAKRDKGNTISWSFSI